MDLARSIQYKAKKFGIRLPQNYLNLYKKANAFIDFDDIVRKPPFFRKRLFLTKSIRSFEGSMKFFLSVKNFSKEENQKVIDRLEEIKKKYGVVSREKDLRQTEKILNR